MTILANQPPQRTGAVLGIAAILPDELLRSIFGYMSPTELADQTGTLLLKHLKSFQQIAGVSRRWRAVAKPLFYRVAVVVCGECVFRDSKARNKNDISHDSSSAGGDDGTKYSFSGMSIYRDGSIDHYTHYPTVRSNILLIRDIDQVNNLHELCITIQDVALPANRLLRILRDVGLGESVWPSVERLQFNIIDYYGDTQVWLDEDCQSEDMVALNNYLSCALPSLREISFQGTSARHQYGYIPINQLIVERLHGPNPLRTLHVDSGSVVEICHPQGKKQHAPIAIERLSLGCIHDMSELGFESVRASTLVELTLNDVPADGIWNYFVADGAPSSLDGKLVFSFLQVLQLGFDSPEDDDHLRRGSSSPLRNSPLDASAVVEDSRSYKRPTSLATPLFPVLTRLDISDFPGDYQQLLSLFAASPISKLALNDISFNIPDNLDLSQLTCLSSLNVRCIDDEMSFNDASYVAGCLSYMLATTGTRLVHLDIVIYVPDDFQFRINAPPTFTHNLGKLMLVDNIAIDDVKLLLVQLPNLRILHAFIHLKYLISSADELVEACRRADAVQPLMPLSTSLRSLIVCGRTSSIYNCREDPLVVATTKDGFNRAILLELICCLPSLVDLQLVCNSLDSVRESIDALVESGVASERIGHLRYLQPRALEH
ncbi:hypothetical protein GGI01_003706 [Coemansia sp. RSA 376]|nr:hypothetical protein GGH13_001431 [Coemansia sp. S155-1]KAJ2259356.1 hypothetical protein GGI01_003706 [Coemansia sp. RSA 376]KAJ2469185.1 hypothetical protein GGI03_000530 [Coemansia sp. RSA 2337]